MMNEKLSGVFIPVVTPFKDDEIDYIAVSHNIKKWNDSTVAGYMVLGSNGEFRSMNDTESNEMVKRYCNETDKVIIAGVSRESLYHTLKAIDDLEGLPIDFFSILMPHYWHTAIDDAAQINYFTKAADHSAVPVLLYTIPRMSNKMELSPDVVRELSAHPNIPGIKDSSKGHMDAYCEIANASDSFDVLAGSFTTFYDYILKGGSGGVLSGANYMPDLIVQVYTLLKEEKIEQAAKLYHELSILTDVTARDFGVAGVKAAMNVLGFMGGTPREPLMPVSDGMAEDMKIKFAEYMEVNNASN